MSSTYKKNPEANNKVHDLKQKTKAALDRLADVCKTFEDTWANVENDTAEGDIFFAEAYVAMDDLATAQQYRLEDASLRTTELKRKADVTEERSQFHRERCRRATKDHVLNNSLDCLGALVKETARATHALTCGVPDRESNGTKYLKEALDTSNDWQSWCFRRSSQSHEGPDTTEAVLVVRPQLYTADVLHQTNKIR